MDSKSKPPSTANLGNRLRQKPHIAKRLSEITGKNSARTLIEALSIEYGVRQIPINAELSLNFGIIGNNNFPLKEKDEKETTEKPLEELNGGQIIDIILKDKNGKKVLNLLNYLPDFKNFLIILEKEFCLFFESKEIRVQSDFSAFKASNFADYRNILNFSSYDLENINGPIQTLIRDKINNDNLITILKQSFGILYLLSILHEFGHYFDENEFDFDKIGYDKHADVETKKQKLKDHLLGLLRNEKNAWNFALNKVLEIQNKVKIKIISKEQFLQIKKILNTKILTHILGIQVPDKDKEGKGKFIEKKTIIKIFNHFTPEEIESFLF